MNILYIGAFSPKSLLIKYPDHGLDTYKVSVFLIQGFRRFNDVKLDVISAPDVGSFPRFPLIQIPRTIEDGVTSVGFYNLPIIKQLMITQRLYKEACQIIERNNDKTFIILPYVVHHYERVASKLKHRYKNNIVICQIVPDIFSPNKWINKILNNYAENIASKSDVFVFFTKSMANYYGVKEGNYIIVESVIDSEIYDTQVIEKHYKKDKKRVVYTGALGKPNGVSKLIDMMRIMNRNDFELWVTGRGSLSIDFINAAKQDPRIHFLGTVSKEDVFKYQSSADLLINPRSDNDDPIVTRYMFPSKLTEYMLTGNPVLTCKMVGIPEEYYNYVFVSEDDTPGGLASIVNRILDLPSDERELKGQSARKFIMDNKSIPVQSRRIIQFFMQFS